MQWMSLARIRSWPTWWRCNTIAFFSALSSTLASTIPSCTQSTLMHPYTLCLIPSLEGRRSLLVCCTTSVLSSVAVALPSMSLQSLRGISGTSFPIVARVATPMGLLASSGTSPLCARFSVPSTPTATLYLLSRGLQWGTPPVYRWGSGAVTANHVKTGPVCTPPSIPLLVLPLSRSMWTCCYCAKHTSFLLVSSFARVIGVDMPCTFLWSFCFYLYMIALIRCSLALSFAHQCVYVVLPSLFFSFFLSVRSYRGNL